MNGLQAPPGYEEIEEKKKPLAMPRIPSPPGYEEVPEKELKPARREPELGDWKKELPGAIKETLGELPVVKGWSKFITKQVPSGEFWKRAGETARNQAQQFLREKLLDPREAMGYKSVMEEKKPRRKVSLKEIGKQGLEFITFLPVTFDKFVQNPGEVIEKEPLNFLMLATVLATGGAKAIKTKATRGKPVMGKDIHRVVDKMPEKLLTKKQKLEIKSKIPEQMELPLGKADPITPAQKIMNALKPAKLIRKEQEALYTKVRGERFPRALKALEEVRGRKGFEAAKAKLKGEMEKVEFEPIVQKLSQADVESLFNQIIDSPAVVGIEKMPAGLGLAKLLGKKGGVIPTAGELKLLSRVFGDEFVQTILSKRTKWDKIKAGMLEGANVPRALMASYDLSFGLRQGIFLAGRYPKEFASSFIKQFKLFGSEKAFKALREEIVSRPTHELMVGGKRKLQLTEMDAALSLREEAFMGAAWAEKIPLVGKGVRASNRAYTGFANKLRADVFDHLIKSAEKTGRNPWKDPKLVESIVDFVNAGSGRGSLKILEKAAVNLNTVLFSPRLIASRLNLLNPRFYYKLDPFVRKQALQSLFAFAGMTTTVLGLAKLGGLEVSLDPRSADFAKIKIGNTRLDIMGGFQQYIRTAAQFMSGRTVSTTTGRVSVLGEGYKPQTRLGILSRGAEYKLAPVASFAVNLVRGQTTFGEPMNVPDEIAKRFVPMVIQDVNDLAKIDPELLPVSTLGFFGTGIQTYERRKKEGVVY